MDVQPHCASPGVDDQPGQLATVISLAGQCYFGGQLRAAEILMLGRSDRVAEMLAQWHDALMRSLPRSILVWRGCHFVARALRGDGQVIEIVLPLASPSSERGRELY